MSSTPWLRQSGRHSLVERVEVADDRLGHEALAGEKGGAAVGGQQDVRPGGDDPVPGGVAVLAVEEHDGERATPVLRAGPAHAISRRGSGNAAS